MRLFVLGKQVCPSMTDSLSAQSVCTCFNSSSKTLPAQRRFPVLLKGKKCSKISFFLSNDNGAASLVFLIFPSVTRNFLIRNSVQSFLELFYIFPMHKTIQNLFLQTLTLVQPYGHTNIYIFSVLSVLVKNRAEFRMFYRKRNKLFHC